MARPEQQPRQRMSPKDRLASIKEAAQQQALKEGLQTLTHRSLAARLGVSHSLIVHYISDLAELRAQTYSKLILAELSSIQVSVAPAPTAIGKLTELIGLLSVTGREETASLWLDGWTIGRLDALMAAEVRAAMLAWQDFIEEILNMGVEAGDFDVDDVSGCAWEIIALFDGLNSHMLVAFGAPEEYRFRIAAPIESRLHLQPGTLTGTTNFRGDERP